MTDILSKPREDITEADIRALTETKVPESETLEFKSELPSEPGVPDPWMRGKDEISAYAKQKIVEEAVAFANAYGGVLVLGIGEEKTVATNVTPIRDCKTLADRLKLVFRDCVDPQLPHIEIFDVETEGSAGVLLIRAPKSRLAPHAVRYLGKSRNAKNYLKCPIRRSDRCETMTMREIQDMTLNLSRGHLRIDTALAKRADLFSEEFYRLHRHDRAYGLRFTALPVGDDVRIDRLLNGEVLDARFDVPSISV
ncbi:MAG: ATP-binding protein, partial [Gammaproteobacteria bacterium]|nr:ATP-binding protein [Gammaproteobacteria bacterium]